MNVIYFTTSGEFRSWLEQNHDKAKELWVGYYKKGSGRPGISRSDSIDEALCFGWIDGLGKRVDEESYAVRFTPRSPKSIWSKINVEKVEKLVAEDKMMPAGLKAVEIGKKSGAWDAAYRLKDDQELPNDLKEALLQNPKAWENFNNYSNSNKFVFIYRIDKIKGAALRAEKIKKVVALIEKNLKPYDENRKPLV